jgi:ribosome-associated protein
MSSHIEFEILGSYIELIQLLKAIGVAQTGGHAKLLVDEGNILRNGQPELRKRAKLQKGESISVDGLQILLI